MYVPKDFAVNDRHEMLRFINANAFGQIISLVEGRLFSSHIPFLLNVESTHLLGHIAKSNPQWRDIEGQEVMITLEGPHDYISPSWYHSNDLPPTWNYQAAHIYGKCSIFNDVDKLKEVVDYLTAKYEANFEKPWVPEYSASMLRGIVGLEVEITDIQCKYKLSQNRIESDRELVIENLQERNANKLSKAMIDHNK